MAASPDGRFIYGGGNGVNGAAVDDLSGALITINSILYPAGSLLTGMAVTPDGKFLYVSSSNSFWIAAYARDSSTGLLSAIAGSPFPTGQLHTPQAIAVRPDGNFLYVADEDFNTIEIYGIAKDGVLSLVPSQASTGDGPFWIAIDPADSFLYVTNQRDATISAFGINPDGTLESIGIFHLPGEPQGIAVDPSGRFVYVVSGSLISAFTIDLAAGSLSSIAGSPYMAGDSLQRVQIDSSGSFLYVTNSQTSQVFAFQIDPVSGALQMRQTISAPSKTWAIAVSAKD